MKFLSIVTPTYNRAEELKRCYESLSNQSEKDFEWIIVDDGSTDNTEEVINTWIQKSIITIRYFKQENLGRYMALNKGVEKASSLLCMYMDSDDWFVDDAINKVKNSWFGLSSEHKDELCGLSFLCYDDFGKLIGNKFPSNNYMSDFFSVRIFDNIRGDKKEIIKTDLLKQYRFPYFKGQKRMPTSYVLFSISKKYKAMFINEPIIYKQYINTGWSKNIDKVRMKNAITSKEYYKHIINLYYPFNLKNSAIFFINYFRYCFHSNESILQALKNVKFSIMIPIYIFVSLVFYKKDQYKYKEDSC